ncbi:MAG: ExbD/TolR family protein [Planctomycetota bacterium]
MAIRNPRKFQSCKMSRSFNMTPVIDIVFLLIIFFLVVCQFIEAENFPVEVPAGCDMARNQADAAAAMATVTVMKTQADEIAFAVGAQRTASPDRTELVAEMIHLLDLQLKTLPENQRIVTLRIDKEIGFSDAQYALAAVAQSCAKDIRLAALKDKPPDKN